MALVWREGGVSGALTNVNGGAKIAEFHGVAKELGLVIRLTRKPLFFSRPSVGQTRKGSESRQDHRCLSEASIPFL